MEDYDFKEFITVADYATIKNLMGDKVKTEQGVRTQIRQIESGLKTEQEVGFQVIRFSRGVVFIKIIDPETEAFRIRLGEFLKKNLKKK